MERKPRKILRWRDYMDEFIMKHYLTDMTASQIARYINEQYDLGCSAGNVISHYGKLTHPEEPKRTGKDAPDCRYNRYVGCFERGEHCLKCGWNPDIAAKRHEERIKEEEHED